MKILDPWSGATIADVATDDARSVAAKYRAARAAQPRWAAMPIRKRIEAIARFRERIVALEETLARTLTHEVGKPIRQSRNELKGLLARLDFFLAESARTLRDGQVHASTRTVESDGARRSFHQVSSPLMDESGRVVAAIQIVEKKAKEL